MKVTRILLFVLFANFFSNNTNANFAAGDITYKCVGGNNFLVSFNSYWSCDSNAIPSSVILNFSCSANNTFNFNVNANQSPFSGTIISPNCSSALNSCNGGSIMGIKEIIYEVQVILPPCNQWTISTSGCCRTQVTNVGNTNQNPYFVLSKMNNSVNVCHNSPKLNLPVLFDCYGKTISYPILNDSYGDSLSYNFNSLLTTNTDSFLAYYFPYAYSNVFGVTPQQSINSTNSNLEFYTPNYSPIMSFSTMTGIEVNFYDSLTAGYLGTINQNIYFKMLNCDSNSNPELSGIDTLNSHVFSALDTVFEMERCAGSFIDFDINSFDADTFNSLNSGTKEIVNISWNNGIPDAIFTVFNNNSDSAYAHFTWTPLPADTSILTHCFLVTAKDNACPYYASSSKKYCLKILPSPAIHGQIPDTLVKLPNPLHLQIPNVFSVEWKDSNGTVLSTNNFIDIIQSGLYILSVSNGYCIDSDTFNVSFNVGITDDFNNQFQIISLHPNPASDKVNIEISSQNLKNITIEISDLVGNTIWEKSDFNLICGKNYLEIPLEDKEQGMYLIRLIVDGQILQSKKLILLD